MQRDPAAPQNLLLQKANQNTPHPYVYQMEEQQLTEPTPTTNPPLDRSDYIALIALAVSLVGTLIGIRETNILREQQQLAAAQQSATVLPYVATENELNYLNDSTVLYTLQLTNEGVGPAIIADLRLQFDDRDVLVDSLMRRIKADPTAGPNVSMAYLNSSTGGFIPAGATERLFALELAGSPTISAIRSFAERFDLHVCYCSVYNECWRSSVDEDDEWNVRDADCNLPEALWQAE